jgi:hypothetical protein
MVHNKKILKQKNSLRFGIIISIGLGWVVLVAVFGLLQGSGGTFSAVAGIYLGYKLLRLILRFFSLFISLFLTVVSIVILIAIISLLIF